MKSWRNIFFSLLGGCVLFAIALVTVCVVMPAQSYVGSDKDYGYVYSGDKSSSVAFNTASMQDDSMLVFGSSELSTPSGLIPEVPAAVFGKNRYGLDLTYVGEAYDQSLWQGIAAGAYAPSVSNKKVVIIVSPNWFTDDGLSDTLFGMRFSYSLYRAFCDNPNISDTSKAYVAKRLEEQDISEAIIGAGMKELPQDYLNDSIYAFMDDLRLRNELRTVRNKGFVHGEGERTVPDFDALTAKALEDYSAASTNNDWGIDDAYYTENIASYLDRLSQSQADETLSDTPEYDDLGFLLRVCQEAGLEPLVIIPPLNGYYYDYAGLSAQTRATCYTHIKSIADAYGVQVADFTDREYEKGFLHDAVHFGWTGWVDAEKAMYTFAGVS